MTDAGTQNEIENCFATRFVLPGWWVRAYEVAATSGIQTSVIDQICSGRIAPALNQFELNGLADLVAIIQRQILLDKGKSPRHVTINPQKHAKHLTSKFPSRLNSFDRTLFSLSGLRLLETPNDGALFKTVRMIFDEQWLTDRENQSYSLSLLLAEEAPELLLGYSNGYLEISRIAEGKTEVLPLQHPSAPLSVWRSPWLDLQGVEQLVLLRLEQAMQWQLRWLQLDGIFGIPIAELLANLPSTHDGLSSAESLKIIDRVGKKLYDHGLLSFDVADQYLAIRDEPEPILAWQASRDRLHEQESDAYTSRVFEFFVQQIAQSRHETLMAVLSGRINSSVSMRLLRDWQDMVGELAREDILSCSYSQTSHPVLSPLLFLEWSMRSIPGHPYPLSDDLLANDLARLCDPFASRNMGERYQQYIGIVRDQSDWQKVISSSKDATFAAPVRLADTEFRKYIQSMAGERRNAVILSATDEREPSVERSEEATRATKEKEVAKPKKPSFNLRRLASEELQRMRSSDPTRYDELKQVYIASLDPQRRKLLMDVQQRMQPDIFNDQLKHSLLKFMIENPNSWRSAKSVQLRP